MELPSDFDFDNPDHQRVHADWLEEQGEHEDAEAVRVALTGKAWAADRRQAMVLVSLGVSEAGAHWQFGFLRKAMVWSAKFTAAALQDRQFRFLRHLALRRPIDLSGVSLPSVETLEWMPDLSSAHWVQSAPRLRRVVLDVRKATPDDVPAIERLVACAGRVALTVVIHSRQVLEAVASRLRARSEPTTLALDRGLLFDDDVRALVTALGLPVEVRATGSFEDDLGLGVTVSDSTLNEGPGLPVRSCCGHCLSLDALEILNDSGTSEWRCLQCGRYTSASYMPYFEDPPPPGEESELFVLEGALSGDEADWPF